MNTSKWTRFTRALVLVLFGGMALWTTLTQAAPGRAPLAQGGAPTVVAYQGQVVVGGAPYTGNGYFKFAVVNAAGSATYWSNDGSSAGGGEPTTAVQLTVSEGLFGLLLGDTSLSGMTQALTADVFSQPDRYLRVWFSSDGSTFSQLTPDTRIAAVPYALQAQEAADADTVDGEHASAFADASHNHAPGDITPQGTGSSLDADTVDGEHASAFADAAHNHAPGNITPQGAGSGLDADTVDGLHASELGGTHYQNVVIVAKSGGDYTSVQAAIDSITTAAADNPYLVWVAPGVYEEQVTMKPHVHLQGAGQEATVITSTASSSEWPPDQATLTLASHTSLRDLTVGNGGAGVENPALLATEDVTRTLVAEVTTRAQGGGTYNYAILLSGSGTGVTLQQVTALAEGGSNTNYGLCNDYGATATLRGGTFTGRGGSYARGIDNSSVGTTLVADGVTALAEKGSNNNHGLYNGYGAAATLRGGSFTGRGGEYAQGIYNTSTGTTLVAESITALGADSDDHNRGLDNDSSATLRGGTFTALEGTDARGIYNHGSGAELDGESVTALGQGSSEGNYGLYNATGAAATLRGGSLTGRGEIYGWGVYNSSVGTTLVVDSVTALGENGAYSYGLHNYDGAATTLRGGSFTGRGGTHGRGIYNSGSGATLDAESVTALGEGSSNEYGLYNANSATANATQSVLEGATYSVYRTSGTVTASNSRLVGGAVSGTVTCVAVSRGTTFNANGCP